MLVISVFKCGLLTLLTLDPLFHWDVCNYIAMSVGYGGCMPRSNTKVTYFFQTC